MLQSLQRLRLMKTSYYHHQNNSEMGTNLFQNQGQTTSNAKNTNHQNPPEIHCHLQYQKTFSISMMTYSKPKTKVLKNSKSLAYKADSRDPMSVKSLTQVWLCVGDWLSHSIIAALHPLHSTRRSTSTQTSHLTT